jgi:hypothetical protein
MVCLLYVHAIIIIIIIILNDNDLIGFSQIPPELICAFNGN